MAKSLEQIVQEQLGGMVFQLATKDVIIAHLQEEIEKLKAQLPKDTEVKEEGK